MNRKLNIKGKDADIDLAINELFDLLGEDLIEEDRIQAKGYDLAMLIVTIPIGLLATLEVCEKLLSWAKKLKSRNVIVRLEGYQKDLDKLKATDFLNNQKDNQ